MYTSTHSRTHLHVLTYTCTYCRTRALVLYWLIKTSVLFNPFSVPACKMSGLKDARTTTAMKAQKEGKSVVADCVPATHHFISMRFDESPFTITYQCEKENRKVSNFAILLVVFE